MRLAAPIANTVITAASSTKNCSGVIAATFVQVGIGSDEAAALSVASESTNIATSENFSISGKPQAGFPDNATSTLNGAAIERLPGIQNRKAALWAAPIVMRWRAAWIGCVAAFRPAAGRRSPISWRPRNAAPHCAAAAGSSGAPRAWIPARDAAPSPLPG